MTQICVSKLTIIGRDNGLSPGWRQAIVWTNAGILIISTSETKFSEVLSEIQTVSFRKMHLKMSSAKWLQFCLGLNVLMIMLWVMRLWKLIRFHVMQVVLYWKIKDHAQTNYPTALITGSTLGGIRCAYKNWICFSLPWPSVFNAVKPL